MPNKKAVEFLRGEKYFNVEIIVNKLIEGGFIEDIPQTEPERLAEAAKKWLSQVETPWYIFNTASGWNTDGWSVVMDGEEFISPNERRNIFYALVILAKEAGIDL